MASLNSNERLFQSYNNFATYFNSAAAFAALNMSSMSRSFDEVRRNQDPRLFYKPNSPIFYSNGKCERGLKEVYLYVNEI